MKPDYYLANARMYTTNAVVAALWNTLFAQVERASGVPLRLEVHAWPADIEKLWARPDLGLVFMCGKPFRNAGARHKPIAVPLPRDRPAAHASFADHPAALSVSAYCTSFLVRADSPWQTLSDSFGSRLGWTVEHSHSGFNAVRYSLLPHMAGGTPFPLTTGPLHTPARCLQALLSFEADIVPMDSYYHTLLTLHCPERLAGTRVLAQSPAAPMPFLAASPETPEHVCERLRNALYSFVPDAPGSVLPALALEGFAPVNADAYLELDRWEAASDAANIHLNMSDFASETQ